ncbi:MAG: flagellin [Bryobacter sp.]|nr:flagellin [Bryobacter sp.]
MSFSINTNVASLQAQSFLNSTSAFQNKTISRVTSGLRIVNSGDDAAGLAIANGLRSDQSVLTQGIRNANDGLSQLQIIDGGINNISQLLDRARTLATQSASGTFTGSRTVLNEEFTSVIEEIDRQAQAIGLNSGGEFAKSLSVFIGGGKTSGGTTAISNGSVAVDLSQSTVDAKSLGLKGVQATGISGTDIGTGSSTSVANILADTTNQGSQAQAGFTEFVFRGSGFSDDNAVTVSVNLSGVTDSATLATAVNDAIESAGNGASQFATAFKNAGVSASVITDTDGKQRLAFTSANSAFQVQAGDRTANALLGNFSAGTTGVDLTQTATAAAAASGAVSNANASDIIVRINGGGLASPVELTLDITGGTTDYTDVIANLSSQIVNNSTLQAAGITVSSNFAEGQNLSLVGSNGEKISVETVGDTENALGFGRFYRAAGQTTAYSNDITGTGLDISTGGNETLRFALADGTTFDITAATGTAIGTAVTNFNAAFAANANAAAIGLYATDNGGQLQLRTQTGTEFRVYEAFTTDASLGFNGGNAATGGAVTTVGASSTLGATASTFNSGGAQETSLLNFSTIARANDDQTITLSATDSSGAQQNLAVVLRNDSTTRNALSIDDAIDAINTSIQQSNNDTLKDIVAVKQNDGGTEKIRFLSTLSNFKVSVGSNASGAAGITTGQGTVLTSSASTGGATADIATQENAQAAVTALAEAVAKLGSSQAVVGRGQNQFNFAVNLAQSQLTNLAASESRIRDADLAQEAANLTKAQIKLQAGVAALAQANSAPQQILSLLRG